MRGNLKQSSGIFFALVAVLGLQSCGSGAEQTPAQSSAAADADGKAIMAFAQDGSSWPAIGGDYSEQRFSPLTQISKENVGTLGLAWEGDVESERGLEATPIMVDGVIYVTGTWSRVFAFDAASGKKLWSYDPEVPRGLGRMLCCDVVNRGVAVSQGKVYVGTLDGRLISLDAKSGDVVWAINTVADPSRPYTLTGAPRVINGRVIIGNSGADRGVRGYVTAYDAQNGKEAWRFWVVPEGPDAKPENDDVALAAGTWPKTPDWEGQGGGTAWDAMAFDPALNLLYIGTGNGGSWRRRHQDDTSDNLYVSSIVAVNADTGKRVWHYQVTPGDKWDYTATNSIILADMTFEGKPRKLLFQAPKNGFFYVLDRETGELLGADKYGAANWASHVDMKTGKPVLTATSNFSKQDQLIYPNPNGAHDWQSMSFNPQTGLAYIPALDVPWVNSMTPGFRYFYDLGVPKDELARMTAGQAPVRKGGFLRAWDVANRKMKWEVELPGTWNGGTLSTAAGLVFQAAGDGHFNAYDAADGKRLMHIFTGTSAMAAPITYSIDGVQYVALLAGYGGAGMLTIADTAAVKQYENKGRLLVFKLNGAPVPLPPKRAQPLGPRAMDNSKLPPLSAVQMEAGKTLYLNCAGCHGANGSTAMLPNLNRVREIGKDGLRAILLDGALEQNGMPRFDDKLKPADVDALYEYISRGYHNQPDKNKWY
ncbi:MAG TPA: PQQ-dependent dehydrogenase, methanol/ethanol family [Sphingobium sp.]|nr:PQQ-dependent dehydrogenase, methanol/ethanol family [Sphingobium sp.]